MEEFIAKIDGKKIQTLNAFQHYISQVFNLPEYFSNNLDSLSECLNDLSWINCNSIKLIIENSSFFLVNELQDRESVLELLNEVSCEWHNVPNYEGEEKFRNRKIFQILI